MTNHRVVTCLLLLVLALSMPVGATTNDNGIHLHVSSTDAWAGALNTNQHGVQAASMGSYDSTANLTNGQNAGLTLSMPLANPASLAEGEGEVTTEGEETVEGEDSTEGEETTEGEASTEGEETTEGEASAEGENEGEASATEGETPGEGEIPAEGEGEMPADGEGEAPAEGEGEALAEGEGEAAESCGVPTKGGDWRTPLGDWLGLAVGLGVLLVSRRSLAAGRKR
jgi:hypothetical protein